jgi:HK97 family phage major capsid protein
MFGSPAVTFGMAAVAAFALLAVWLALEPFAARHARRLKLYAMRNGRASRLAAKLRFPERVQIVLLPAIQGGSPELDVEEGLTEGEKAEVKKLGEVTTELRSKLMERLKEKMTGDVDGGDKEEIQRREKELGEHVDKLIGLAEKQESTELTDFKAEFNERMERFEAQMKDVGRRPIGPPKGGSPVTVAKEDAYPGDNMFRDIIRAKKGDFEAGRRFAEYEEKFCNPEREKAWAQGELEENDLILPDVQAALPFLRAQARATALFRELRTNAPSVTFPVFKSGLTAGFVKHGEAKPEAEPTFDLRVAEVFTLAGISDIPNPLLEDFPAARGWISSELGSVTGAKVEIAILSGDGTGEPLGLYANTAIPKRKLDAGKEASAGRNIVTSVFRGAQQVRITGFMEPTDVLMNPAVWTDVALSFETNIGFLYSPPVSSTSGSPAERPPERIMGLPVTWSSYVPTDEGEKEDETSVVVGNFMDGVILRRSPFRIDVDTSIGFKKNLTSFRGEERMGFIVVRPKSFVRVEGIKPSPVE